MRPEPSSHAARRLGGLDGIRGVAALTVLVAHVWLFSGPATVQVGPLNRYVLEYMPSALTMFFVLSGFLLYRPFAMAILTGRARTGLRK